MAIAEHPLAERPVSKSQRLALTPHEKQMILQTAKEMVQATVAGRAAELADPTIGGMAERTVSGAFVCLKRNGHLRSCCGSIGQPAALAKALAEAVYRTVWEDARFPPVSPVEVDYLDMEVWVLADPERSVARGEERVQAIEIGRHGLVIERGQARGLLLPGVALDHGWDARRFLEQTCTKAGLHPSLWKDEETILFTFEGDSVRGRLQEANVERALEPLPPWFTDQELAAYAEFCRQNISALARGATPTYYLAGANDGTVNGIVLIVRIANDTRDVRTSRISLRPGLPLQSTLFTLAQDAAQSLFKQGLTLEDLEKLQVSVAVFYDPALHGTVTDCDLAGLDSRRRALLVMERSKAGLVFCPQVPVANLVRMAVEQAQVSRPARASVFSLAALSTDSEVSFGSAPRPIRGSALRKPAVAGQFYPAEPEQLSRLVDELIGEAIPTAAYSAAMVPHAGLIYSGKIAASVFKRIRFPGTIIVVGPKHTPHGMDWAIAPQQTWTMPGFQVESDLKLVRQLAQSIAGLELDSMAHRQEHAIEVELPFIPRLAPESRVVGIALAADTDYADCARFAEELAGVLRDRSEPALLVISSDMNHFATDSETRTLDEIAIGALETLSPQEVYETVTGNSISMCGLVPAVIVLQTLRLLGLPTRAERVGYATTAEVTGDPSRVVGYAGMLFGRIK
jgi:AmmeMemoRadiSam system protein B/AmmeMemoRadiSam system protein A